MNPGEPSRTAIVVAKSQALVGMSPETASLVPPDALRFVQCALEQAGYGRFVERLRHRWFRRLVRSYESLLIPGLALHHTLRKQAVERIVRRELLAGASQVVQIGAGLDSLAFRLHREFPEAGFSELDHPATGQAKLRVINALGGAGVNLALRPVDLTEPSALRAAVGPGQRSVVIVEGVLMYFEPDSVRGILHRIHDQLSPNSLLLFTFMESPGFHRQSPLVSWWLRSSSEPFRWSVRNEDLASFLGGVGLNQHAIHSTGRFAAGPDRLPAAGELLCEARSSD